MAAVLDLDPVLLPAAAVRPVAVLVEEVERLRKQAQGTPPGVERERLLRRARQVQTASHITEWLSSKELQPPT